MEEIYFSQIREDSRVEVRLQDRFHPRRIACIGSGGCTALSLLNDSVETVHAVDINRAQCALIELKKAALSVMDREAYLAFIGETPSNSRVSEYLSLKDQLPAYAQKYWDRNQVKINRGINRLGVTERFYQFVGRNLRENVCGTDAVIELLNCTSLESQREVYDRHFSSHVWKHSLKVLFSKTSQIEFYPTYWFTGVEEDAFSSFFAEQFEREVSHKDVSNNYFLSQLFLGAYLYDKSDGTPPYLTDDGFKKAKANIHKLKVLNASLKAVFAEEREIDAFFLSNVFDWGKDLDRKDTCDGVLRAKSKEALILYRNMYEEATLPHTFMSRFNLDISLSSELFEAERSMLYRKVSVGMLT